MMILTRIQLLVFTGFLNFKRADGQPNPNEEHHLPDDNIILRMRDNCIYQNDHFSHWIPPYIPDYLLYSHINPDAYHVSIYLEGRSISTYLNDPEHNMFNQHDLERHTPKDVYFNIDGEFYSAKRFRVYEVTTLFYHQPVGIVPANYPEPDIIFVGLPINVHNRVYWARLTHLTNTGQDHSHSGTAHVLNMLHRRH